MSNLSLKSTNQCKLFKVLVFVHLLSNVNVRGYRSHWWHTDNHNYNHNQNQIGPYQDGGDGNRPPDHGHRYAYDARTPKDIMVDVINNMGLALLEAHNEHNENNIAISPYGATSVLVALLEGLVGEAAYEIKIATQLPPDLAVVRIGLRDIHRHLKSYFIPKEGFLAGLTLSHENITLNREYQSILKFYGYDIESFNNPVYPDVYTSTSSRPAVTMTTGKVTSTTMRMETRTTDLPSTTMEMTTELPKTTTMEGISTEKISTEGINGDGETTESTTQGTAEGTSTEGTTQGTTESTTEITSTRRRTTNGRRRTTTTEIPLTTTDLPSPSEEDVEGTTTKKLPTRSYTTEAIAVTDMEGRTETFYPITTLKSSESDLENESTEEPTEDTLEVVSVQVPSEQTEETSEKTNTDVVTDSTLVPITNEELRSTPRNYQVEALTESVSVENNSETTQDIQEILNLSTIRTPATSEAITKMFSFKTTNGEFFEATTYLPGRRTTTMGTTEEIPTTTEILKSSLETSTERSTTLVTFDQETSEGSTSKYATTFEGTTFFAIDSGSTEGESQIATDTNTHKSTTYFNDDSTENVTTEGSISTTTQLEDFVTLTERDNEIFSEISQKLTNLESTETTPQPTNMPVSEITFTTSEPSTAYTQTQNTEATSLEDQVLDNKTYTIAGKLIASNKLADISTKVIPKRNKRSAIDYLIARYYDNYYVNNNRRYVPPTDIMPKMQYSNYQPEQPYTFLVNGKHKETNISFMTYDTILPFYYIRSLDAMALSFPLDSNMYYLLLVLPLDAHGIDKLVYDLRKTTSLRHIVERLQYTHVKAVIPSFMLKGYVILTPTLQKLCIRKIFEPRHANFSPMTPEPNLYVTNIEQAVTVTIRNYVDPASHSARTLNQYRPVEFRADHPFLYFVMDSQIHVNLMSGKIINPLNSRIR